MNHPFDLMAASMSAGLRGAQLRLDRAAGRAWIEASARRRLAALVRVARERSPFYRERYAGLPVDPPLQALPRVSRRELMARFDDWATDRRIRCADAARFVADPANVGAPFLGRYTVWTSSGSTGEHGVFVQDDEAMAVYDALVMAQADARAFGPRELARWSRSGGSALIVATGAPYPAAAAWGRLARLHPALAGRVHPITLPLPELVARLARQRPAFVSTYPTVAVLLALERQAGRLAIAPASVWCGGECLAPLARATIESAFGCRVHNEYGAAECFSIGASCPAGALHLNADWVIVEPVDAHGEPVPPGEASHGVLVTNLANALQPVIRCELGDSVRLAGEPCSCGSPLPVIEVQGRTDDVLWFAARDGRSVAIVPLALEAVIEEVLGAAPFQVVRQARELRLRLPRRGEALHARARERCVAALRGYLDEQGLGDVRVVADEHEPALDPRSGKLRRVLATA